MLPAKKLSAIGSSLIALHRLFGHVVRLMSGLASIWIFAIMILVTLDITMRFIFGGPISGVTELVQVSIVMILFMQVTHALKVGRITRSDALFFKIQHRYPTVGNVMGAVFNLAGVSLMAAIIVQGWPKWLQALDRGYFVGNVGVFTFPEWPQRLIIVIGCAAMAVQFFILAVDHIRAIAGKPPLETEAPADVEIDA